MNFATLFNALPGACAQGLIWGCLLYTSIQEDPYLFIRTNQLATSILTLAMGASSLAFVVKKLTALIGTHTQIPHPAAVGIAYICLLYTSTNFEKRGFMIKGMFDINPRLIGLVVRGVEIRGIDDLEQFIVDNEVQIAALTIPKSKAPEIAERLVKAGIKAIWNFAHTDLNVPDDVVVENVHLSESLMRLSYRVCSMQDERERKAKEKAEQTGTNETC